MKKVFFVNARLCQSVIKHVSFFVLMLLQQGNLIAQNAATENPSVKLENTTQQEINSNLFQLPVLTDQERDKITNPQEGTVIYNKSSKKPQFFNGHRWIYFDNSHGGEDYFGSYRYIGESYGGGIIFYLDSTGQHGLICSPFDLSAKATWGFFKEQVAAHDLSIGSGFTNTEKIVRASKKQDIAAYICYRLDLNNFKDWYLPSKAEMEMIFVNIRLKNMGNFSDSDYWTSSETDFNNAWTIDFRNGVSTEKHVDTPAAVRAIRSF